MTAMDGGPGWAAGGGTWEAPDEGGAPLGEALRAAGHWLGAAGSVALVAGIGFWGWQTVTREAHGVPIVRALAGEMRVAPDEAGGTVMPDQGLSLGAVQEGRGTAAAPEAVTLAPSGTDIAVEDRLVPLELAPAPEIAAQPDAPDDPASATSAEIRVVDAALPGVVASPRPSGRPAILAALGLALRAPSQAPSAVVMLGEFETAGAAREAWLELSEGSSAPLGERAAVIESVTDGGREVWRLRATNFDAPSEAARLCDVLRGEGIDCTSATRG